jgi:hypothetical protein
MPAVKRRFASHQNQPPPLVEHNVGDAVRRIVVTPLAISNIDHIEQV